MSDYTKVKDALQNGADPAMLCATCPWDRFCVTPPAMTSAEVEAKINEASEKDRLKAEEAKAKGEDAGMPVGMLLTAMTVGGRDTSASVCPVMALRLRSSDGDKIVRGLREQMKAWDDQETAS